LSDASGECEAFDDAGQRVGAVEAAPFPRGSADEGEDQPPEVPTITDFDPLSEPNSKRVEQLQKVVTLFGFQTERSHECLGLKPLAGSIGGLAPAMQAI
jgi:hypothetical protein